MLLAAVLALAIGGTLGLLGGGGSILTVPILVYALHVEPKSAIVASLVVVGVTSFAAMLAHARKGAVRWKIAGAFGGAAMVGAYVGGRFAHRLQSEWLMVGFGALMIATALAMLRQRPPGSSTRAPAIAKLVLVGVLVGVVAGLIGAGGGFLIVPALVLFGGLAMRESIGTSLLVITMQSAAGFAGQAGHVSIDWPLVLVLAAAAVVGSLGGAQVARRLDASVLRKAFAWFVLAMGLFVLGKQLPWVFVAAIALLVIAMAFVFYEPRRHAPT